LPKESEAFKTWNGKRISDILNYEPREDLPFDAISALTSLQPEQFADVTDISLYFPRPFLQLGIVDDAGLEHQAPPWDLKRKGIEILEEWDPKTGRMVTRRRFPHFTNASRRPTRNWGFFTCPLKSICASAK
jgi:hypothetical protein